MRRSLVSILALLGLIALPMFIARVWAEDVTANQTDAPLIVTAPPSDWLPDEIEVASDLGTYLRDVVLRDYQQATDRTAQRDRSRAHMARIYEAIE